MKSRIEVMLNDKLESKINEVEFDSEDDYQKYGTYNIFSSQYIKSDFNDFKSLSLEQWLKSISNKIPVTQMIVICRRHPECMATFLRFFDTSKTAYLNPKIYLPILCQWVDMIPIQWVVHHILRIKDVRYAYQLSISTFSSYISISPNTLEEKSCKERIWKEYMKINPSVLYSTPEQSWNKLVQLRTAMKELIDLRMDIIKLSDYIRLDKKDVMKQLLLRDPNHQTLIRNIKQIMPYCKAHNISLENLVMESVCRRNWDIEQKLSVVKQFISNSSKLTIALEKMSFRDQNELEKIREFATNNDIVFEPDPNLYVRAMISPIKKKLARSNSFDDFVNQGITSPSKLSSMGRAPSADVIDLHSHISYGSLSSVANGDPPYPHLYAKKLSKFKDLKEIKPVFELAEKYDMVVSYDDYTNISIKKDIFDSLIRKRGFDEFDDFVTVLNIDSEQIVDIIIKDDYYKKNLFDVAGRLVKYATKLNLELIMIFLKQSIESYQNTVSTKIIAELWYSSIKAISSLTDGNKIIEISNSLMVLEGIINISDKTEQNIIFKKFYNEGDLNIVKNYIKEQHIEQYFKLLIGKHNMLTNEELEKAFLEFSIEEVTKAIQTIFLMTQHDAVSFLINLIPKIDGKSYSQLQLIYNLLIMNKMNYQRDREVLSILFNSNITQINFHKLMKNPLSIIQKYVNIHNIYDMIALATVFDLNQDKVLLHLMIEKIDSLQFDDYSTFISLLNHKSSLKIMLDKLSQRFSGENLIKFYRSLGLIDKMHEVQSQEILKESSLSEFNRPEMIQNPQYLICEMYSKSDLQTKFGQRLHDIVLSLSNSFKYNINKIQIHLLNVWLLENDVKKQNDSHSIYIETSTELEIKDDHVNIQKILFILRVWKLENAIKFLSMFLYQKDDAGHRANSKALLCLFTIATLDEIRNVVKDHADKLIARQKATYIARYIKSDKFEFKEKEFLAESIKTTLVKLEENINEPGVAEAIILSLEEYEIQDDTLALKALDILVKNRKHFLLVNFIKFFKRTKTKSHKIFDYFVKALSSTFTELIKKEEQTIPFKSHHNTVLRETFDAISLSPMQIDKAYMDDNEITLVELISQLSRVGYPKIAAEFGIHITNSSIRNQILVDLISNNHFDHCLTYGYDQNLVFDYIFCNNKVNEAVEQMVDESFYKFTEWIYRNHPDSMKLVEDALREQGRTKEIKRLHSRISSYK